MLTLLFRSCHVEAFGEDIRDEALRAHGNKVLGAIWHRNILYIIYVFSRYLAVIMASRSLDGELIAQTLRRFGHFTPRGSRHDGGGEPRDVPVPDPGRCRSTGLVRLARGRHPGTIGPP